MSVENDRIHQRIDELAGEFRECTREVTKTVAELTTEVRASNALCGVCRPIVLGDGHPSMDKRLATVEQQMKDEERHTRKFWTIVGIVAAIITALAALPGLMALGR